MKIEGLPPNVDVESSNRLDRTAEIRPAVASGSDASAPSSADRVQLSPEAELLKAATDAANRTPAVRQDVVDRARALMDRGQIGADPLTLADALISRWMDS